MKIISLQDAYVQLQQMSLQDSLALDQTIQTILQDVKRRQDDALKDYTFQFDHVRLSTFRVDAAVIREAYSFVKKDVIEALKKAKENIQRYHTLQRMDAFEYSLNGRTIGQKITPIRRVGLYIPGGTASYPSSVLMNAIPALIAGVSDIVLVSPPNANGKIAPAILVAADLCGIQEIYTLGGAQAIAALAYGTPSIPRVDKIVGPGNQFVARAKALVSSVVGIDTVAGPSEVCIVADEASNPTYIAADLLAQAEHDPLSRAICVTTHRPLLSAVQAEITRLLPQLTRQAIAQKALDDQGMLIYANTSQDIIEFVNTLAPEHLELLTQDANLLKDRINNAGAMFIGPYTPEPVGDYMAGPNHTLPTSSFARFASGLSTYDFLKRTSYVEYNREAFHQDKDAIITLAEEEGLTAHALSIKVRS